MKEIADFCSFLQASPTVFHAADEIEKRLRKQGFTELKENQPWKLSPSHGYFIKRDHSMLAAFRTPQKKPSGAILLASHIDSPCLKLKPVSELDSRGITQLNTEVYGAPLLHTWLDRDLCIGGKITFLDGKKKLRVQTILLEDHPVLIPGLAPHLDRSLSEKGLHIHKQDHLKPIFSLHAKKSVEELLQTKQLMSADLFLVPTQPPALFGEKREMLAAYRLDNLTSAYAALVAISQAKAVERGLQMALFWDHEEIGSVSSRGAQSLFVQNLFKRITFALKMDVEEHLCMTANSLCLSIDVAHGYHPNYPDKFDVENTPFLGKGISVKFSANQKYATSSAITSTLLRIAQQYKIPMQKTANHSNIPSGSTVGSMMAANTNIATIDLGIPILSMHSIRETAAVADQQHLQTLLYHTLMSELQFPEEA